MTDFQKAPDQDDPPPIMKNWNQLYWLILFLHFLIITVFYLFTEFYK